MDALCVPTITWGKCRLGNALVSCYYFKLYKKKVAKEQRVEEGEPVCIAKKYSCKSKFEAEEGKSKHVCGHTEGFSSQGSQPCPFHKH